MRYELVRFCPDCGRAMRPMTTGHFKSVPYLDLDEGAEYEGELVEVLGYSCDHCSFRVVFPIALELIIPVFEPLSEDVPLVI